jgi:hypothetical protein
MSANDGGLAGVLVNVVAHVSAVVCLDPYSEPIPPGCPVRTPDLPSPDRRRSRTDGHVSDDIPRARIPFPAP